MRNISFALTTEQIRNQTKTVTRRLGWKNLKPGTLLQPVEKAQGLKKGETVRKIGGPIRVVSVTGEWMSDFYDYAECVREGFPNMRPDFFRSWFIEIHGGSEELRVNRIEFEYVEPQSSGMDGGSVGDAHDVSTPATPKNDPPLSAAPEGE